MTPIAVSRSEAARLAKNLDKPKPSRVKIISDYMTEYLRAVEKRAGRRLTQDELLSDVFRIGARVYAEALAEKGK